MKKLVLIDGSSYLFRAYHALPPLTNSSGHPTGAMYGVINMIKKLVASEKPDLIAVVFDTKGKNFRHELYPDYKANRPEMPEELAVQIEPIHTIIQAMGLPLVAVPGVEADDVIGTLAKAGVAAGNKILISTGDKDFAQLVNKNITLINTMNNVIMDVKGVKEKFGVTPEQIIDYLSLVGDSADNIPGVPKVGPKTAVKWLQEYKDLDNIIANKENIKGKVGENLRGCIDDLLLARQLVTIKQDMELPCSIKDFAIKPEQVEQLTELYSQFEFKTWLKELAGQGSITAKDYSKKGNYELVLDEKALNKWLAQVKKAKRFVIDTETTSLNAMQAECVGVSLCIESGKACYIPFAHDYPSCPPQLSRKLVLSQLKPILEDAKIAKIGQNIKYDMHIFANYGIHLKNIAADTMLESYVINSVATRHDMDSLASKYLNYNTVKYEDVAGKGAKQITFDQVDINIATDYAAEDAEVTLKLHEVLSENLQEQPKLQEVYDTIEMPLLPVIWQVEQNGVAIDANLLAKQSKSIAKQLEKLEQQAFTLAGEEFNLASPKQLQEILFDKLDLPVLEKTPKGAPSTAESVLQTLSHDYELPEIILEFRSLSKLKSTYTDKLPLQINPNTQRVHTSYHQAVTATGRLSSSDPNLQNIPTRTEQGRLIRQAFVAPKGFQLVAADYSQIELRIMAHLSDDERLLAAFNNGEDIHRFTASEMFHTTPDKVTKEQRRSAKAINFGLIYGMSAFGLAKQLDVDQKSAKAYMDKYFERYPGVLAYMENIRKLAAKQGYVETIFGRRLYLPDIKAKHVVRRKAAERTAINAPMQGTAADIIKKAMINISSMIDNQSVKMIMQVHDELIFEVATKQVNTVKNTIQQAMADAADLKVPLVVDVGSGSNWGEAH